MLKTHIFVFLVAGVIKVHRTERVQRVYGMSTEREQRSGSNEEKKKMKITN